MFIEQKKEKARECFVGCEKHHLIVIQDVGSKSELFVACYQGKLK